MADYDDLETLLLEVTKNLDPKEVCVDQDIDQKGGGSQQRTAKLLLKNGEEVRLFIKFGPNEDWYINVDKCLSIYERETTMIETILKTLSDFQQRNSLNERSQTKVLDLFPRYFGKGNVGGNKVMVFQDFQQDGMTVTGKQEFHNNQQICLAMERIAVLHAVSYAYCSQTKVNLREKYPILQDALYRPENAHFYDMENFFVKLAPLLKILVSQNSKGNKNLKELGFQTLLQKDDVDKMLEATRDCWRKLQQLVTLSPPDFIEVLIHGDFHMWNMAFSPNCKNMLFFDLQLSRYTSPLIDLQSYLCQVTTMNQRKEFLSLYMDKYINSFTSTLKDVNCDDVPFSKENLSAEYSRTSLYGLLFSGRWLLSRFLSNENNFLKNVTLVGDSSDAAEENVIKKIVEEGRKVLWILNVICDNIHEFLYTKKYF